MEAMTGLYLHVPFCRVRCSYCDFYLVVETKSGSRERFAAAIEAEIRRSPFARKGEAADTLFFGGGTPSLLAPEEIARLVRACKEAFALTDGPACAERFGEGRAEITLEANPEDMTPEKARALRRALDPPGGSAFARLSLGGQSFREDALKEMMRRHGADDTALAVRAAREAGFDSLGLDLLCGFPGETAASWEKTLDRALALAPDHVSLYVLEWHEGTFLARRARAGSVSPPPDDAVAEMYERACERLGAEGFEHYEISNFARPGHASRHNIKYWSDAPYLGFGPGAHSYIEGRRFSSAPHLARYLAAIESGSTPPQIEEPPLTPEERARERLVLALRMRKWRALDEEERALVESRETALRPFVEAGWIEKRISPAGEEEWRLAERGILVSNEIFAAL